MSPPQAATPQGRQARPAGVDPTVAFFVEEMRAERKALLGAMDRNQERSSEDMRDLGKRIDKQTATMLAVTVLGMLLIAIVGGANLYFSGFGFRLETPPAAGLEPRPPAPVSAFEPAPTVD